MLKMQEKPNLALPYKRFRESGYSPAHALSAAKTRYQWEHYEYLDVVRIRSEHEQESYFDVYGDPEGYINIFGKVISPEDERKEIEHMIETYGCLIVITEYRCPKCGEWIHADSIGMNIGYRDAESPFVNFYDLMQSAIDQLNDSLKA